MLGRRARRYTAARQKESVTHQQLTPSDAELAPDELTARLARWSETPFRPAPGNTYK
jgi:hypothetical protein